MPVRMPTQLGALPKTVPSDINEKRLFLLIYLAQSVFCYDKADRSENFNDFLSMPLFENDRSGKTYQNMTNRYQALLRQYEAISARLHHPAASNTILDITNRFRDALNEFSRSYLQTELHELFKNAETALLMQMLVFSCDPLYTQIFANRPIEFTAWNQDLSLGKMRDTLIGSQLSDYLRIEDLAEHIAFASPDALLKHIQEELTINHHLAVQIPDIENAIRLHRFNSQRFAEGNQRIIGDMLLAWIAFKENHANQGNLQSNLHLLDDFLISDTLIDYPDHYGRLGTILKKLSEKYEKQYSFFHRLANRSELDKLLWIELSSQLAKANLGPDFLQSDTFTQLLKRQEKSERELIERAIRYTKSNAKEAQAIYENKVTTLNEKKQRYLANQDEARAKAAFRPYASSDNNNDSHPQASSAQAGSSQAGSSTPHAENSGYKKPGHRPRVWEEVENLRSQANAFWRFLHEQDQQNQRAFRGNWEKAKEEKFAKSGQTNKPGKQRFGQGEWGQHDQGAQRQQAASKPSPSTPPSSIFAIRLGGETTVKLQMTATLLAFINSWRTPRSLNKETEFPALRNLLKPILSNEVNALKDDNEWASHTKAALRKLILHNHPDRMANASAEERQQAEETSRLLNNLSTILNDHLHYSSTQSEAASSSRPNGPR